MIAKGDTIRFFTFVRGWPDGVESIQASGIAKSSQYDLTPHVAVTLVQSVISDRRYVVEAMSGLIMGRSDEIDKIQLFARSLAGQSAARWGTEQQAHRDASKVVTPRQFWVAIDQFFPSPDAPRNEIEDFILRIHGGADIDGIPAIRRIPEPVSFGGETYTHRDTQGTKGGIYWRVEGSRPRSQLGDLNSRIEQETAINEEEQSDGDSI